MCDPVSATALASTALSMGATYAGQQRQAKASQSMAMLENQRQRRYQERQAAIIADQERAKERGRQEYENLQPQLDRETTESDQAAAQGERDQTYQSALSPAFQQGADPTAATSADVRTVSDAPRAVSGAMDREQQRAFNFASNQAASMAALDAINDAQRQANIRLSRGAEGIAKYGDFVSGLNRPLTAYEGVKDSSSALYRQGQGAAMSEGDTMKAIGSLLGQIGQAGYGWATQGQPVNPATLAGVAGSPGLASSRPVLIPT